MKRYFSAAVAAAALIVVTGCEGREEPPTQVSTSDPSAGITSNYTSQSLQAETVTSSIEEKTIETLTTETVTDETETSTVLSTTASSTSAENVTAATSSSSAAAAKTTSSTKQSSNGGQAGETTSSSSSSASHIQTTTTTSTTSQISETTTRPAPSHEEIIEAYIKEVEKKIGSTLDEGIEDFSVDYTLYDMDENGIPELIMRWASANGGYQITFYTYDEFGTKVVFDGIPGDNANFACVPDEKQFVLAYSDMYKGELYWMDYEELDKDMVPQAEFVYSSEETYEEKMAEFGVERLPYARYSCSYEEHTQIFKVINGELDYYDIAGRDFSFIYNYEY